MTESTVLETINVLSLPYTSRQLVMVQPDAIVAATRKAEREAEKKDVTFDWASILKAAAKSPIVTLGPIVLAAELAVNVAAEAWNAWAKARAGGLNLLQIAQSEAQSLQFPPGHPREGTMYVAHPATPTVYYTTAAFHRMVFEHKFAEAIVLLMSLGAKRISVEHVRGWSREFSSRMAAAIPRVEVEASTGGKSAATSSLLFDAHLANSAEPAVPESLIWYPHEPTWQAIAQGRIKFGLLQFALTVDYEDDFGVNAGLKLKASKAGIDLGGAFEDHQATTWKIHGEFVPKA